MKKKLKNKVVFIPGLGQKASQYRHLPSWIDFHETDWNNPKLPKKGYSIVIGFSLGAYLACDYAIKYKVKHLILCSPTPGMRTLKGIRADKINFIVGQKEAWVREDLMRLIKTKSNWSISYVDDGDHKIDPKYLRELLLVLNED